MIWYAKSGNKGGWWEPQLNHLTRVAERSKRNAEALGASEQGHVAGLLHDLGKYGPLFLDRLRGKAAGLDHWSMGAAAALKKYKWDGIPIACAILGHHVGLESGHAKTVHDELASLIKRPSANLAEPDLAAILQRFAADGLTIPESIPPLKMATDDTSVSRMLDIRMLFSALVDADAYWSEAHREGDANPETHYKPRPDGPELNAPRALDLLLKHMAEVRAKSTASPYINEMRDRLFQACLEGGAMKPGLFTLAAPTGAGKTWAMLAFALQHAAKNPLRRVIVVIPYLSIIEQTVADYRSLFTPAFGERFLIEDHSMAGVAREKDQASSVNDEQAESRQVARLLAENWDAPVVVTTSVQCLESLFANRPAACRKLHNIAGSVILFDEVQTLPLDLAVPTLAALSRLTERYGCSVVVSTATQPAFDHLDNAVTQYCAAGWKPREITAQANLFVAVRAKPRFEVDWQHNEAMSWKRLARELAEPKNEQVLCIVNLKAHARILTELLRPAEAEGVLHLSTNMCPAHRTKVLAEVKRRLDHRVGEPCRLISTQCVEAGVNVDFPAVYRAMAPLEAIAQAAGRCNRGAARQVPGRLVVFLPEEERYPMGGYEQAAKATKMHLQQLSEAERRIVLDSPELLRRYYTDVLYPLMKAASPDTDQARQLKEGLTALNFVQTAECYRLIKNDAVNVLVPYDCAAFGELVRDYESKGRLTREWLAAARAHTVGLFRPKPDAPGWTCLRPLSFSRGESADSLTAQWFHLDEKEPGSLYDTGLLGLKELRDEWIA